MERNVIRMDVWGEVTGSTAITGPFHIFLERDREEIE
jgi:hypothetical protein